MQKYIEREKNNLSKDEIEALKTPTAKRDGGQQTTAFTHWQKVAERATAENRGEALRLASQFEDIELRARDIRSSRDIVN